MVGTSSRGDSRRCCEVGSGGVGGAAGGVPGRLGGCLGRGVVSKTRACKGSITLLDMGIQDPRCNFQDDMALDSL